jgi:hypothetical protein
MDQPVCALTAFSENAHNELWLAESRYIAMDVSFAIARTPHFTEVSHHLQGKMLVFEVEWSGRGTTLCSLRKDFFSLYGMFAEQSQFIEFVEGSDDVIVNIVCGSDSHGHCLIVRLIGQRVARVLRTLKQYG